MLAAPPACTAVIASDPPPLKLSELPGPNVADEPATVTYGAPYNVCVLEMLWPLPFALNVTVPYALYVVRTVPLTAPLTHARVAGVIVAIDVGDAVKLIGVVQFD